MAALNSVTLGIIFILLGLVIILLTLLFLRAITRGLSARIPAAAKVVPLDLASPDDAVLKVLPGGRVEFGNDRAKEWFGVSKDEFNLERLARRTLPSDAFLSLCAAEGQTRFSLDGHAIEGASYLVPDGSDRNSLMVVLHRPKVAGLGESDEATIGRTLEIFSGLSQTMAGSLQFDETLQAILSSVEKLIPSDLAEITVFDNRADCLVPYRFSGFGSERQMEKTSDRYRLDEGYSGYLVSKRKPLLVQDVDSSQPVQPAIDRERFPFRSYLGVPLIVAGNLVGTLELASLARDSFTQNDVELLSLLSGQASIALHNAILFQAEQQQARELAGLARLAQVTSSGVDLKRLYERLVQSLERLLDVKLLGFISYDEAHHMLTAQHPFLGVPEELLDLCQLPIPPRSPVEVLVRSLEVIHAEDANADTRLEALGLQNLTRAAGIKSTVLLPLSVAERCLGYLQVGGKKDGTPFGPDDHRLLGIIAGQISPILENVSLVQESRRRAQRSEALRQIASLAGSVATKDEILRFSVRELAKQLEADVAVIYLLDEELGELRVHQESLIGIPSWEDYLGWNSLPVDDPQFRNTITNLKHNFITGNAGQDERILMFFRPAVDVLGIESLMDVPLIVRERGIGEIILASRKPDFFDQPDLLFLATASGQLAGAIERAILYTQTDEKLRRRVEELTALTRISRELNSTVSLKHLLKRVFDEAVRTTRADNGRILLFESGVEGSSQIVLALGEHTDASLNPLELQVLETGEAVLLGEIPESVTSLFDEATASVLIVPILYQENVVGLIHLWSHISNTLDRVGLEIGQALSVQAAIALGNALRYQDQLRRNELLNRRVDTLAKLMDSTRAQSLYQPIEESLQVIAQAIREATPFDVVLISLHEPASGHLIRKAGVGLTPEQKDEALRHSHPWSSVQEYLQPEYRIKGSYFIPMERKPVDPPDVHTIYTQPVQVDVKDTQLWNADDLLLTPIWGSSGEPLGIISVDQPKNGLRPDLPTLETLDLFAGQSALMIVSHQRLNEVSEQLERAQNELYPSRQSADMLSSHQPLLQRQDFKQPLNIHRLSHRASLIKTSMDVAESVNRQQSRTMVLETLGRELLSQFKLDVAVFVDSAQGEPKFLFALGTSIPGMAVETHLGQRNPLRQTLQSGELLLVGDLAEAENWIASPILQALETRAFVCMPIQEEGKTTGAALFISRSPEVYEQEDQQLFQLLVRQVALALQNVHLLDETNRRLREVNLLLNFSQQLSSLEPDSILETMLNSAMGVITDAQAGVVFLWDQQSSRLVPKAAAGYADNQKIMQIIYPDAKALPGKVFAVGESTLLDEIDFARDYDVPAEDLLLYHDATAGRLPSSSMLAPIQSGDQKWGLALLDNFSRSAAFNQDDQGLLSSLTQQAALALENARLYQAAENRARQLQSLTEIAGSLSSSLQSAHLISTMLTQLRLLVPFDTGTLWIREGDLLMVKAALGFEDNENRIGLTESVADSRLFGEMIASGQPVLVEDVSKDARFPTLEGYRYLSWLGLPLTTKGDVIGVIALEKTEAGFFSSDNVQFAMALASQAAVSLETATLIEESLNRAIELDERTQRLSLLNRLSTELSSSLEIEPLLETIIRQLFNAIRCTSISIMFYDRAKQVYVWAESPSIADTYPYKLPVAPVFDLIQQTGGIFHSQNVLSEEDLQPLLPFLSGHQTHSLVILPITAGKELLGLIFVHEKRERFSFSPDEIELARTISNQSALSIQNARSFQQAQQRLNELSALNNVSQQINATIELDELLSNLPSQLVSILDTHNMYLALYDADTDLMTFPMVFEDGKSETVQAGKPAGLTGYILETRKPLLLVGDDVDDQMKNLGALQYGSLPAASYLGVPLLVADRVIGVLAVQDPANQHAYNEDDVRLLSTVAAQVSVAVENSRLYTEARQRSAELTMLYDYGLSISEILDERRLVDVTFHHLQRALNIDSVAFVLKAGNGELVADIVDHGSRLDPVRIPGDGSSYSELVLNTVEPLLIEDTNKQTAAADTTGYAVGKPVRSWLGVPISVRGTVIGVLSLHSEISGYFEETHLRLVSQVAIQLSTAIENARLIAQTQNYADELALRVEERTTQLSIEHQRTQTLLRIITELSASLDMDIVLSRTLALINQNIGAEQSSIILLDAIENNLTRRTYHEYNLENTPGGYDGQNPAVEKLAGSVVAQRQSTIIPDLLKDPRWEPVSKARFNYHSALIEPLMVGEENLGSLVLLHREAHKFTEGDEDLVRATAKQIAVAINNAKLYRLIRDQAERLGDMLRTQHIETSRSQAILEAVADGVIVTDAAGKVTLFNASAERILQLNREKVISKSLESFVGLFGKAGRSWIETIRNWSKTPDAYQDGDLYAERIELDDGRVVSVHLSPVRLRREFLGTVSIFRDITHEVEVDRLKSEFVANVSHELRTPMTSIKGYIDVLLMGAAGEITNQQKNFLDVVKTNTERLIVLVNDLLEVSRIESGKVPYSPELLDLRQIGSEIVDSFRERSVVEGRPMNFDLSLMPELPRVLGDSERVRQIINNLVDNAYHYTPAGGIIHIRIHRQGDEVQVDVQDNGIGIPLSEQASIFDRFYRGEDPLVLETPGTGLGLSVVQSLVAMHGGRIWVESLGVPGEGSTFSFTLPVYRTEE